MWERYPRPLSTRNGTQSLRIWNRVEEQSILCPSRCRRSRKFHPGERVACGSIGGIGFGFGGGIGEGGKGLGVGGGIGEGGSGSGDGAGTGGGGMGCGGNGSTSGEAVTESDS